MKIHLVCALACRAGGADVYTEELAVGLAERGHQITVICHGASNRVQIACETFVASLPLYDEWSAVWRIAPWLRWKFWQRYLSRVRLVVPDVIICSKSICTKAIARRFPDVPLVYLPHSRIEPLEIQGSFQEEQSWLQRQLAYSISSASERWSLLNATTTVRFTAGNVDDLQRHYRLPRQTRFKVIPAGIVGPTSITPRACQRPVRLLSLGRLVGSKNLEFLLDALASIPDQAWTLDIVGDGPERAALEQQATQRNLAGQVRFHGHHDDVDLFYKQADLFVFPSRLESYGLVILEAMSHGVPTLAIRADGNRYRNANHEIIAHEQDGLLTANEDEFVERLAQVIANPAALASLSRQSRQTFIERHEWRVVLDRWEELLQQLTFEHAQIPSTRSTPARTIERPLLCPQTGE